jgi:O-antigen/teichoic acid export membrane protein
MAPQPGASEAAAGRAAKNTFVRALGEIVGKLATFVLFAAIARELGEPSVGIYVFAFACLQIAMAPVDFGLDRYLLREVARERASAHRLFFDVLALKLTVAIPALSVCFVAVTVLDYSADARHAVFALSGGMVLDSVARVFWGLFMAHERGELVAAAVVVQRVVAAALGLVALAAGYGVVAVAGTYTVGSLFSVAVAGALLFRTIGRPRFLISPRGWRRVARASLPFGAQDVFSYVLFRADAVLLSLMASEAALGRYGAAYRLFESTTFLSYSVSFAFQPMYSYLNRESNPTIGAVFQRSIKFSLFILLPIAITFGVFSESLMVLFFGAEFADAADALRLLAAVVVLDAVATLGAALILSHGNDRTIVGIVAGILVVNIVLNVALIPVYAERGAAAAWLASELVFAAVVVLIASRRVGGLHWSSMLATPALAGAVMAGVMLLTRQVEVVSIGVGVVAYVVAFLTLERLISPSDLSFVIGMITRRFGGPFRRRVSQ